MAAVTPDNQAALEFLQKVYPDGPWVLTAIRTDRKAIDTKTFRPSTKDDMLSWLKAYNGERNIYWSTNPPIHDITKKAEREDIKEVAYLHVDIDPRAGEDLEAERIRCLALFREKLPPSVPPPTVVLFSGGGYQAFWKLETPIPVNGDLPLAEDAKRWNQQLELLFGGDNCHNIDRIMRLPGTINVPDAKKIKKGRTPTLAKLVSYDATLVYPLSKFTAAPVVQLKDGAGFSGGTAAPKMQISGNIPRLDDINELDKWGVPDRVKVICVQGKHPDEPKVGDNSRSMWIFDAVCQMLRNDVPDEVIFSILMDPEFGISESVIEKGSSAERYAIRQIERAKEHVVEPMLRELNEKYAVIGNIGGKCRVVEEVMDPTLKRSRLTRISFDDFANFWRNRHVAQGTDAKGMPQMVKVGKWWLDHPMRRQFNAIVFAPGQELPNVYNLWKGFAVEARPGDCSLFLDHIKRNVCGNSDETYGYVLNWMARAIQQPDSPGEVALVLRGGKGVGKSFFAKQFGAVFGRHFLHISNPSHLVGNFNAHLRDVVLLFADEAFFAGDRRHESILKTLITEETIQIEAKGVDVESSQNFVHLIMASNADHVVPVSGDERRFLVLDVSAEKQQQSEYFKAILEQMEKGGRSALLHMLMNTDISAFDHRKVPQTDALQSQKDLSLGNEEDWWYHKLLDGAVFDDDKKWPADVRKEALFDDYNSYTKRWNVTRRGNQTSLQRFLLRYCPKMEKVQRQATYYEMDGQGFQREVRKRAYFWTLPTLQAARDRWDEVHGKTAWTETRQLDLDETDKPPF